MAAIRSESGGARSVGVLISSGVAIEECERGHLRLETPYDEIATYAQRRHDERPTTEESRSIDSHLTHR